MSESEDAIEYVTEEGETCSIAKERVALTREGELATLRSQLEEKKVMVEHQKGLLDAALSGDCLVVFFDPDGEPEGDPVSLYGE